MNFNFCVFKVLQCTFNVAKTKALILCDSHIYTTYQCGILGQSWEQCQQSENVHSSVTFYPLNKEQYKYTMQNKFSIFVWVSPSTLDLTFHFLLDNDFHVKDCRIFKRSACANVTLDFETSAQNGHL